MADETNDNEGRPTIASEIRGQQDMAKTALVKAVLVGGDLGRSEQIQPEEQQALFGKLGALDPPYDPEMLCILFEHSNSLRQNVDAYATNIHAFGHRFDPVFEFDGDDAQEQLEAEFELREAREKSKRNRRRDRRDPKYAQDALSAFGENLKREIRRESIRLKHFFEFC